MTATYDVYFTEPMHGVRVGGTFERFVYGEDAAEADCARYQEEFRKAYKDPYAFVELVEVSDR